MHSFRDYLLIIGLMLLGGLVAHFEKLTANQKNAVVSFFAHMLTSIFVGTLVWLFSNGYSMLAFVATASYMGGSLLNVFSTLLLKRLGIGGGT